MMLRRGNRRRIVLLEEESAGVCYYLEGKLTEVTFARRV